MPSARPGTGRMERSVAELRIRLAYLWRHGRAPDLARPVRFTELVQYRKLTDRNPLLPILADKLAVKRIVAERIGSAWVTPTLWHGTALPVTPRWRAPFVVKARHGCNQNTFVMTGAGDWSAIRASAARWMRVRYGAWLDEWAYLDIPRGLLVEPFIGSPPALPIDYKLYVFGGRVEFIQVHLGRSRCHRWMQFDRDWQRVSSATGEADPPRPATLAAMVAAAEALGADLDFVRVDLYEVAGRPRFGEMTFYPGSGLDPFDPPELDLAMGAKWLAVTAERPSRGPMRAGGPGPIATPVSNAVLP